MTVTAKTLFGTLIVTAILLTGSAAIAEVVDVPNTGTTDAQDKAQPVHHKHSSAKVVPGKTVRYDPEAPSSPGNPEVPPVSPTGESGGSTNTGIVIPSGGGGGARK